MTDRPIIFSAPMVRALIEGRKTQTRRIIKQQAASRFWQEAVPAGWLAYFCDLKHRFGPSQLVSPIYAPGDRLYVREAHALVPSSAYRCSPGVSYTVNPDDPDRACVYREGWERSAPSWRPSIHMPRWASRLTLTVTDVRVQRLQDISEADAVAEGIERLEGSKGPNHFTREITGKWSGSFNAPTAKEVFADLWSDIHGPDAWDANPWCVAISFTVKKGNIDAGGGNG